MPRDGTHPLRVHDSAPAETMSRTYIVQADVPLPTGEA
jgi:hypothetical protein